MRTFAKDSEASQTEVTPVEFIFNENTGILEKYRYYRDATNYDEVTLNYNDKMQLTSMTDWLGTKSYVYDNAGRVTSVTGYNSAVTSFTYNDAGQVTAMTDNHGGVTTNYAYQYNDLGLVSQVTSPGNKVWTFSYNQLGQPTSMTYPNGMVKYWGYDTRNRLTRIYYKDQAGGAVIEDFDYTLDDLFNVTRMDQHDGSWWDYGYDDRYRLTSAVRNDGNIAASYSYTYDNADNLLTKTTPFEDDFTDGDYSGWSINSGTWSAANGYIRNDVDTAKAMFSHSQPDGDAEISFRYLSEDTTDNGYFLRVAGRHTSSTRLDVRFHPDRARALQWHGSAWSLLDEDLSADTAQDTWYNVRMVYDGTSLDVWRWADGEMAEKILSTSSAAVTTSTTAFFQVQIGAQFQVDDIRIINSSLSNTTTYAYNDANELTSMTTPGRGTTSFEYDAWGRMTRKYLGSSGSPTYEATYGYAYDSRLTSVTTDWPDESDVQYEYTAFDGLYSRTANGTTTYFNNAGGIPLSELDASGNLTRTYLGLVGVIEGANPATGDYHYQVIDFLNSTRALYDENKTRTASIEYEPFGSHYSQAGSVATSRQFTAEYWDSAAQHYQFLYRSYRPDLARWTTREPSGIDGPNLYHYVFGNPISNVDLYGLSSSLQGCAQNPRLTALCEEVLAGGGRPSRHMLKHARKRYPRSKGCHKHHILPKHMGFPKDGPVVSIPWSYHNWITKAHRSRFDKALKEGGGKVSEAQKIAILKEVYALFPLGSGKRGLGGC